MNGPARPQRPVRQDAPQWADLVSAVPAHGDGPYRASLDRDEADDWTLVLRAMGIPHRLLRDRTGWRILVPPARLGEAVAEIAAAREEQDQAPPPPPPRPAPFRPGIWSAVLAVGLGTAFHLWSTAPHPGLGLYPEQFHDLGIADSTLILRGEWWRALTALTLHADAGHFTGNAVIGGIFGALLAQSIGSGRTWALFVLSGLAGNLLNAWFHGPGHLSVGASTGVFGLVGAMAGAALVAGRKPNLVRAVAPVAAGMGILAMLGTGGERTDLGAHLFGFLAGLPMGALAGRRAARAARLCRVARLARLLRPGIWEGRLLGLAAFCLLVAAWVMAFAPAG